MGSKIEDIFLLIYFLISTLHEVSNMFTRCSSFIKVLLDREFGMQYSINVWSIGYVTTTHFLWGSQLSLYCTLPYLFITSVKCASHVGFILGNILGIAFISKQLGLICVRRDMRTAFCTVSHDASSSLLIFLNFHYRCICFRLCLFFRQ